MQSKVARDIRQARFAGFAALSAEDRVALAMRLGEECVAAYMAAQRLDRHTAIVRMKHAHRAGRRPSACAADGDR